MRLLKKVLNSAGIHARYRSASENSRLLTTPTLAVGFCFNFQTCVHRPGASGSHWWALPCDRGWDVNTPGGLFKLNFEILDKDPLNAHAGQESNRRA
jgi:hypothetical protein